MMRGKSLFNPGMFKTGVLIILAVFITCSLIPLRYLSAGEAGEAYRPMYELSSERLMRGLIGFGGEYSLDGDCRPINVIVVFEKSPAAVQVIEAEARGYFLPFYWAEQMAEDAHRLFRAELAALSGYMPSGYVITREYRIALNGAAVTLPSGSLEAVAQFQSVRAIHPNHAIMLSQSAGYSSLPAVV